MLYCTGLQLAAALGGVTRCMPMGQQSPPPAAPSFARIAPSPPSQTPPLPALTTLPLDLDILCARALTRMEGSDLSTYLRRERGNGAHP